MELATGFTGFGGGLGWLLVIPWALGLAAGWGVWRLLWRTILRHPHRRPAAALALLAAGAWTLLATATHSSGIHGLYALARLAHVERVLGLRSSRWEAEDLLGLALLSLVTAGTLVYAGTRWLERARSRPRRPLPAELGAAARAAAPLAVFGWGTVCVAGIGLASPALLVPVDVGALGGAFLLALCVVSGLRLRALHEHSAARVA